MSSKNSVRELMKSSAQKRNEKTVDSPLARYTPQGVLFCILCKSKIKSASQWQIHCAKSEHQQNLLLLQKLKRDQKLQESSNKALVEPGGGDEDQTLAMQQSSIEPASVDDKTHHDAEWVQLKDEWNALEEQVRSLSEPQALTSLPPNPAEEDEDEVYDSDAEDYENYDEQQALNINNSEHLKKITELQGIVSAQNVNFNDPSEESSQEVPSDNSHSDDQQLYDSLYDWRKKAF